jgi:protein-S-isoprenylcysteine O-methyltransferase Ste14
VRKRLIRWCIAVVLLGGAVLAISGRWSDPWLWTYVGVWAVMSGYAMSILDDDLARERFNPPEPGADRLSLRAVRLIAASHLVIGALDYGRWHLTTVPATLRVVGLIGMALSFGLVFHSMSVNRFFSAVVRVQRDRGHHVIDRGPYAIIRHPGYAGMIPSAPMSGLALGSWLAFAVGCAYSALIIRRVFVEDAFLHANLDGYVEYASRVRYRLIPGVF